jgi:4'-phosphopantetheinyl transferase
MSVPELDAHEVHVWDDRIVGPDAQRPAPPDDLSRLLSGDEVERAERYRYPADRQRFVRGRTVLRLLIGSYTGAAPESVQIVTDGLGKPSAQLPGGPSPVHFSVSHSGSLVAWALSRSPVGIDVEMFDPARFDDLVVGAVCSPHEAEDLSRLTGDARTRAFFRLWVRKEAVLKAWGNGLNLAPATVQVRASPTTLTGPDGTAWRVQDVSVAEGYASAVAQGGAAWRVRLLGPVGGGGDRGVAGGKPRPA